MKITKFNERQNTGNLNYLNLFGYKENKHINDLVSPEFHIKTTMHPVGSKLSSDAAHVSMTLLLYLDLKQKGKVSVAEGETGAIVAVDRGDENIYYSEIKDGHVKSSAVDKISNRTTGIKLKKVRSAYLAEEVVHIVGALYETILMNEESEAIEAQYDLLNAVEDGMPLDANIAAMSSIVQHQGDYYLKFVKTSATIPDLDIENLKLEKVVVDPMNLFGEHVISTIQKFSSDFIGMYDIGFKANYEEEKMIKENEEELIRKRIIPEEDTLEFMHELSLDNNLDEMYFYHFRGISGSGKSIATRIIAAGLKIPHRVFSTSEDTDAGDIVGRYSPNTRMFSEKVIEEHAANVYFLLTGEFEFNEDNKDDQFKLAQVVSEKNGEFVFEQSSITDTFINGGLCEIQEMNLATPQTFAVLNRAFEEGRMNVNGTVYKKHPQAIFVATTNPDYIGTYTIQESVNSRLVGTVDFFNPSVEVSISRVCSELRIKEDAVLKDIAEFIFVDLPRYKKDRSFDGVVDYRSFKNTIKRINNGRDVKKMVIECAINKLDTNTEDLEEVVESMKMRAFSSKKKHTFKKESE